ncbi:hypothetical protein I316_07088 [Kwoniella heveanensis BCC8398]|uniref:Uncharacterized protein n=1 Tax=Kwoniella heveanensis BCC8398 TaxID=1296120 RepID=A0A1B9GJN3_9TREE|nr:hypothetical protein I316_07088 [Kwoniella heveanensis BCC8398]
MTASASPKPPVPMPNGMFLHESPNGSSTSLSEHPDLALPNPAFRRRNGGGSNRSSIASQQDLSSLTSEELWALGQEQDVPDMSNPMRQAAERPLDTVRRMSKRIDKSEYMYHGGLPGDVIWPAAPPVEEILPASMKSKSFTNVASLGMANRRMSKRGRSRQSSVDMGPGIVPKDNDGLYMHGASVPASPAKTQAVNGTLSSAQSSSTSLASQGLPPNKSFSSLSRPPSTYYSRDFLSSLAPREGGYAIAAQMGGGLGAHGTMSVEEKRRSSVMEDSRSRTVGSRAPLSKSAGMGRWSLDGGEHYGKPYATPSAATTSSNLSAPPINSAEPSPPADEITPQLPEGASPAFSVPHGAASTPVSASPSTTISAPASAAVPNPSPLSQQTSAEDIVTTPVTPVPPPVPASSVAPPPALTTKKSKKQLAKEAKAAEKAEAVKVARARAEAARNEALKKQQAKEEAKRKEKEEKARRKAEKKAAKNKKSAPAPVPVPAPAGKPVVAAKEATPASSAPVAPTHSLPAAAAPTPGSSTGGQPFPKPVQSSQSAYKIPVRDTSEPPRQTHHSMPLSKVAPPPIASTSTPATAAASSSRPAISPKRSFFGTIKKRLSYIVGNESNDQQHKDAPPVPPVPKIDPSKIPQASTQKQGESSVPPIARQHASPPSSPPVPPKTEQLAERPPRRDSLAAPVVSPKLAPPVDVSPPSDASSFTTKETAKPSIEGLPTTSSPVASPNLHKTISNGASSSRAVSPATSPRKRNSLVGPRPMPESKAHSRPSSMAASSADHSQSISQSPQPASYSFSSDQVAPVPVTPSTSGDSGSYVQSHASHMTGITPITSPSDTEDGRRSMEYEDGPAREGSKDSNETVHGSSIPATQPVLAA